MRPVFILAIVVLVVTGPLGFAESAAPGHHGRPETPGTPATPATPATPSVDSGNFDTERAARELLIAQERLSEEGGHARMSGDAQVLYTLAARYLSLAQQHYRAGRYYQAAEVATAVTRLADAIRHLSWAIGAN